MNHIKMKQINDRLKELIKIFELLNENREEFNEYHNYSRTK